MGSDDLKRSCEYLKEWLGRQAQNDAAIPFVQRSLDELSWQKGTWESVSPMIPPDSRREPERRFGLEYEALIKHLPLPLTYPESIFTSVSTVTASGSVGTANAVLAAIYDSGTLPRIDAEPYLDSYRRLSETWNKQNEARSLMSGLFPNLVPQYDRAAADLAVSRSQPDKESSAAAEMRTLLDKFQGELFDLARKLADASSKMTWERMAAMLAVPDPQVDSQKRIQEQGDDRATLVDRLSNLVHRRRPGPSVQTLWPSVLDHLLIVCKNIRHPKLPTRK